MSQWYKGAACQHLALLDHHSRTLRQEARKIGDDWGAGGTYRQITTTLVAAASGNVSASGGELGHTMVSSNKAPATSANWSPKAASSRPAYHRGLRRSSGLQPELRRGSAGMNEAFIYEKFSSRAGHDLPRWN